MFGNRVGGVIKTGPSGESRGVGVMTFPKPGWEFNMMHRWMIENLVRKGGVIRIFKVSAGSGNALRSGGDRRNGGEGDGAREERGRADDGSSWSGCSVRKRNMHEKKGRRGRGLGGKQFYSAAAYTGKR
eukprot:19413-Hanusia_phi.AAC.3